MGLRVWGLKFWAWSLGLGVWGSELEVWAMSFVCWVLDFRFRDSKFRVSGFWLRG